MHDQSTRHEAAQGRRHGTGQRAQDCQEQCNGGHGTACRNGWNRLDRQPGRLPDGNGQDTGEGKGRCRRHGQRDRLPDGRGQRRHGTGTGQCRRHGGIRGTGTAGKPGPALRPSGGTPEPAA